MNLLEIWNTGSKQVNRETKDLILIFHNDNPHSKNGYLISLPKRVKNSQVTSTYYISNDTLYECYRMPRFSPQVNKTWFFEEKVVSKANIFGLVKMDPFYIVLEIFTTFLCSETCKNDIIPICIKDLCKQFSEYPSLHNFFELQPVKNCLSSLLDFKSSKYSLNTFKVLFWLKTKFEHIYSNIVESSVLLERISVKKSIFPSVNVDVITKAEVFACLRDEIHYFWHETLFDAVIKPTSQLTESLEIINYDPTEKQHFH